ncbi:MAG: BamA/OMP85 family outer membrane protein [Halanaerobiaceae bacterium]
MKKANLFTIMILMSVILLMNFSVMAQETATTQIITGIELEGNDNVDDSEILSLIETEVGSPLNEEQLKQDLQTIYETGSFQDVSISFQSHDGGLKAIFELIEYPVIEKIIIEGNESFTDERLLDLIELKEDSILNHNKLLEARKAIEELYQDNGYILAGFEDINITEENNLRMIINEGYINEIKLKGNEKTKDFVIIRELEFYEGDVLNIENLQNSFQKLMKLNLFENFNPHLERVEGPGNKANIVIEISEAKTGNLGAGVTWSSEEGWLGFINVQERNFLGNGQTLGFNWEFGGVTNYSINFHEPWLLGTPTSFGVSLYDKNSKGSDSDDGKYKEHRRGGNISLGHKLIEDWNGKIRFKIEDSTIDYVEDTDSEGNPLDTEKASVRSLTLQTNRDTTDHPFNPTRGAIDTFSVEYAGQILGGNFNFTKYNADVRRYYPGFKLGHAWGLRAKGGIGIGDIPELEKYRLGGSESLRGYEYGEVDGDKMLLLNAEYRFPIVDNFTGVVFTDAGNAWEFNEEVDLSKLKLSYGAGLRMNTPIGQIRLDYGFNAEGGAQPHFSIGHAF